MIVTIEGKLAESGPLEAIIEAGGLGYGVHIPVSTAEKLPAIGGTVKLFTVAVYREDSQALYGFHTREDREFFQLLTGVSGIGPKTALSIMSKLSTSMLKNAIAQADTKVLASSPGIGKKTAERLVVELRDKVGLGKGVEPSLAGAASAAVSALSGPEANILDAVAALVTLGYKTPMADKSVRRAADKLGADASTEDLIKTALN